jgi:plasmid stabilization system protein ParE
MRLLDSNIIIYATDPENEGPLRGHSRPDLPTRPVRFWTLTRYPNYTVVYRPETAPLQIVAVLHGKRNIRRILQGRP